MGLDFKKRKDRVQNDLRPLLIDLGDGDTLSILYRKNRVTTAQTTRMNELMRAAKQADSGTDQTASAQAGLLLMESQIAEFLSTVASWDATDDGVPIPLTREGLDAHEVDIEIIGTVMGRINADSVPNEMTAPK